MEDSSELQIAEERLLEYVRRSTGDNQLQLGEWSYVRLDWKASNQVTGGLYRVAGDAKRNDHSTYWSFILKIVVPSSDTNLPTHFNYWKSEILAYQSGILQNLPTVIRAPRFYGVEEKKDKTVRIWLEEVLDYYQHDWSEDHYKRVARLLGNFNSAYLVNKELPSEPWLAQRWLSSWVKENDKYDDQAALKKKTWEENDVKEFFSSNFYKRYKNFYNKRDQLLQALHRLPQVLTHNDAWLPNLFLQEDGTIVAIDWTFVGIAGVGEELGRFYGLLLNSGVVVGKDLDQLAAELFEEYYQGLKEMGWQGNREDAYFGFSVSAGIRCGMMIPQLLREISRKKDKEYINPLHPYRCSIAAHLLKLSEEALLSYEDFSGESSNDRYLNIVD